LELGISTMSHFVARFNSDGQFEIPDEVHAALGLKPGDLVEFAVKDGTVVMSRSQSKLAALYGAVTPHNRPGDFHAIREFVERAIAEEVMESMHRESPATRDSKSRAE
jgi:bifunctional DNA-binding transcriptional regulator/antitoxin component of YhaV-PrlF toxin-antitoxin module